MADETTPEAPTPAADPAAAGRLAGPTKGPTGEQFLAEEEQRVRTRAEQNAEWIRAAKATKNPGRIA